MLIDENLTLKVRLYRKQKMYKMYYVTFPRKYSKILSKFKELHGIEILTPEEKIILPKANLFKYSFYFDKESNQKIPYYSITIPKKVAEMLEQKGVKKVRVIVELPDLAIKKI
jgi:hypothetical protein